MANLPASGDPASPPPDGRRGIGGKATEEEIHLIDRAVLELRRTSPKMTRSEFVVESAVERAARLLSELQVA